MTTLPWKERKFVLIEIRSGVAEVIEQHDDVVVVIRDFDSPPEFEWNEASVEELDFTETIYAVNPPTAEEAIAEMATWPDGKCPGQIEREKSGA